MLQSAVIHGAETSLVNLLCIMDHNQIDILGVSETFWRGRGHIRYTIYRNGGGRILYHIFFSGMENVAGAGTEYEQYMDPRGRGRRYGVAIILSPRAYNPNIRVFYNLDETIFPFMRNMMTINLPHLDLQVTQIYTPACTGRRLIQLRADVQAWFAVELRLFLTRHQVRGLDRVVMGDLNERGPVSRMGQNYLNLNIIRNERLVAIFAENDTYMPVQGDQITTRVQLPHSLICIEKRVYRPLYQRNVKGPGRTRLPTNNRIRTDGFQFYVHFPECKRNACDRAFRILRGEEAGVQINSLLMGITNPAAEFVLD